MKVKDLVRMLKKMDQDAVVATRDHDNSDDELSGWVKGVVSQHTDELSGTPPNFFGVVVVLEC